ncbi:hypothetical protein [uncultured Tateyamaria sp.]|nr:hypothetical protein [uncultured Tateyamaria sp.]
MSSYKEKQGGRQQRLLDIADMRDAKAWPNEVQTDAQEACDA